MNIVFSVRVGFQTLRLLKPAIACYAVANGLELEVAEFGDETIVDLIIQVDGPQTRVLGFQSWLSRTLEEVQQ